MHIKPQISKNKVASDRKTLKKLTAMGRTSQPQSPTGNLSSPPHGPNRQCKSELVLSPPHNSDGSNSEVHKVTKESKKQLLDLKQAIQLLKSDCKKKVLPKTCIHEEKPKKSISKTDKLEKKNSEKELKGISKNEKEAQKTEKETIKKSSEKDHQKVEIKKSEKNQQRETKKSEKLKIEKEGKTLTKKAAPVSPKLIKEASKVDHPTASKIKKMLKKVKKVKPKEKLQLSANYNKKRRVHRMASLNALAKVHILYENDSRCSPSDGSEPENVICDINPPVKSVIDVKNSGLPCVTTNSYKSVAVKSEAKSPCPANSRPPAPKKSKVEQSAVELLKPKVKIVKNKKDKVDNKTNDDIKKSEKSTKNISCSTTAAMKKTTVEEKVKKTRKRKAICDVEIIDTKACKRLACLNAQAILAASCIPDRTRRITEKKICKVDEILIKEKEIMTYNHEIVTDESITTQVTNHQQTCTTVIRQNKPAAKQTSRSSIHHTTNVVQAAGRVETRVDPKSVLSATTETCDTGKSKSNHKLCKLRAISAASDVVIPRAVEATVSKMGVTAEYTEVTKVHINTTKAMQVKEEVKAKRTTIERILEKDDVAITRMYHYQTKGTSQSYCVKMHTTFKPSANKPFPTPPPAVVSSKANSLEDTPEIISTVVHGDPAYYNYNPPVPVPAPQNYSMSQGSVARVNGVPVVSVSPIVRHYSSALQQHSNSSAFTVPQYGASSPSHTPQNNYSQDYGKPGYYPQGVQDPLMVHKPIPYHPPQSPPHQPHSTVGGQAPVPPQHHTPPHVIPPHAHQTNSCSSPSHSYQPPPAHSSYQAQDPYLSYSSPHGNTYHQMEPASNPAHHSSTYSRVSPHLGNHSPYTSQDVPHPQPAHYHPYHHHQRSPMHHPTYPPPLSPSTNSHSPSPSSYQHSNHGSPFTPRHVYSSPSHSPSYQHQDYSNGPVYTVLSPVPMGTKKSNHLQQRISQAAISPGAMHCNARGNRNSPLPKAEPLMPQELNAHNTFQSNKADYSCYPQSSYPPTDNARIRPSNRPNIVGVTPVLNKMIQPITGNSRNITDCCNVECYSDPRLNSKGIREVNSFKSMHLDSSSNNKPVITGSTSRRAKTTCQFTHVQNVEVTTMAGGKQSSTQRRLRAATMAATNSSLSAQRQSQQLTLDKVTKCPPPSSQPIAASAVSTTSMKRKTFGRLISSADRPVPIEIDLTLPEVVVVSKKMDGTSPQTPQKKPKRSTSEVEILDQPALSEPKGMELIPLSPCSALIPKKKGPKKFSNGWSWEGEPYDKLVFHSNDDSPILRRCYPAMKHMEGDLIHARDCVLLKSGPRKIDLPFVAKVTALWETPEDGEMMISLLWYYRPEHTEQGRRPIDMEDEIFASKHRDVNSVACIEDKCYVLTTSEYCRYRSRLRMFEDNCQPSSPVVPEPEDGYLRKSRLPPGRVSPEMVFVCRKVYDFRQKRLLKNPV